MKQLTDLEVVERIQKLSQELSDLAQNHHLYIRFNSNVDGEQGYFITRFGDYEMLRLREKEIEIHFTPLGKKKGLDGKYWRKVKPEEVQLHKEPLTRY